MSIFDRKYLIWGHSSNIVYHVKQQKWQDKKKKVLLNMGNLKTNLSSCIYVHIIPQCSTWDYFYKYFPLKQPIVFANRTCIFTQLLQSIFSYSGEI